MSNVTMNNNVDDCHEKHELEFDDETSRSETNDGGGGMSQRTKRHESLPPLQYDDESDERFHCKDASGLGNSGQNRSNSR
jgi:hypothetical protein